MTPGLLEGVSLEAISSGGYPIVVLNFQAALRIRSWAINASPMASGCSSQSLVELSISVNRKATVPEGRSVMADGESTEACRAWKVLPGAR